jgi:hypothetical protein
MITYSTRELRLTGTQQQSWTNIALAVVVSCALSLSTGVLAQTIDSRDTRTFQDNRVQDTRQSPVPVSPEEAARLKRLTEEAAVPEQNDSRRETGERKKSGTEIPERSPSPRPK